MRHWVRSGTFVHGRKVKGEWGWNEDPRGLVYGEETALDRYLSSRKHALSITERCCSIKLHRGALDIKYWSVRKENAQPLINNHPQAYPPPGTWSEAFCVVLQLTGWWALPGAAGWKFCPEPGSDSCPTGFTATQPPGQLHTFRCQRSTV